MLLATAAALARMPYTSPGSFRDTVSVKLVKSVSALVLMNRGGARSTVLGMAAS